MEELEEVTLEKLVWLVPQCVVLLGFSLSLTFYIYLYVFLSLSLGDTFQGVHTQLILYFLCNILNSKN